MGKYLDLGGWLSEARIGETRLFAETREECLCFCLDSIESLVETSERTLGSLERESLARDKA